MSRAEADLITSYVEDRLRQCFVLVLFPGEDEDPGRDDQVRVTAMTSLEFSIMVETESGGPINLSLKLRHDGGGSLSDGSWTYPFGNVRNESAPRLAALAVRDRCVTEVMCS